MKSVVILLLSGSLAICGVSHGGESAVPCPLGEKEDHLTVSRVMRNFGRYVRTAEATVLKGRQFPLAVTDDDFANSINGLKVVFACVEAATNFTQEDLLPSKARYHLSGANREAYLKEYVERMTAFSGKVQNIKTAFESLLSLPKGERSYDQLRSQMEDMNRQIDESHRTLSCWEVLH